MTVPEPAPAIAALPVSRPFIAPEELARLAGRNELLRLGANESAFGPPPRALEAMRAELPRTSWYGDPESALLREALAERHRCTVEEITVASGIDELLGLTVRAYLAPGDVSVATLGTYPTYAYHVNGYGARLETVPYAEDGAVQLDALAERAHASGARVVYLANPDNPSGSFAGRDAIAAFLERLPGGTLLVLDEAYADFVARDELPPDAIDPRVIRMRTFSKAFGLAGARIAYSLASREANVTLGKIRLQYGVNRTAQIGALAALGDESFVQGVVREVASGRKDYRDLGRRLGLPVLPSRTNFVCFDLGTRERAEEMVSALLRRGAFVRKPAAPPIDRCIRVTVGTAAERAAFGALLADAMRELDAHAGVS